jgi:hypothetical protein
VNLIRISIDYFLIFYYINFRASLVIETINFGVIKYMAHLAMLVIFHVNMITCQNFNLPHIYHIFAEHVHCQDVCS